MTLKKVASFQRVCTGYLEIFLMPIDNDIDNDTVMMVMMVMVIMTVDVR